VIKSGNVLVINCGSSSIKFLVIDHETSSHVIRGSVERIEPRSVSFRGRHKWRFSIPRSTKRYRSGLTSTRFRMTFIRSTVSAATAFTAPAIDS
jgi:acetate kinase